MLNYKNNNYKEYNYCLIKKLSYIRTVIEH